MKLKPLPEIMKGDFDKGSLVYNQDDELYYGDYFPKNLVEDIKDHTLQIYAGYYHFEKGWKSPKIYLIGRGKKSGKVKFKIQNFKPYCYVKKEGGEFKSYLGDPVDKIIFEGMQPSRVKTFRNIKQKGGFKPPYESDILFVRRFLIDTYDYFKPEEPIKPKTAILDIETDHPKTEDLISYAINDQEGDIIYESKYDTKYTSELALNLYEELIKYDIVTGWNIDWDINQLRKVKRDEDDKILNVIDHYLDYARKGDEFTKDEYIRNMTLGDRYFGYDESKNLIELLIKKDYLREEDGIIRLGCVVYNPVIEEHMAIIDMLPTAKKMHAKEIRGKWTLGNVGTQIAGIDKLHLGATRIGDLPEDRLMEYNVLDTIIPEILDNVLGGIEAHLILSWSLQCRLDDVKITAVVNDIAMLRAYHRERIVLPTRDFSEKQDETKYKAAEPEARPAVYNGILVTDIVHAYPYAVISKNISPETKDNEGENVVTFVNKDGIKREIRFNNERSVFIDTLKALMKDRSDVKEKLKKADKRTAEYRKLKSIDFALKTQAAAFSHGIFGWANSRMRDYEVADAITGVVRDLINLIKDACDVINVPWIYVHTDSCFVNVHKMFQEGMVGYLNDVIKDYSEGALVLPELDVKGYYPKGYIHSAARNVLLPEDADINDVDTWDVTGINFMRSEVAEELADIEIEMIRLKLKGCDIPTLKFRLKDRIKKLLDVDSNKLAIIKPLTKEINKYGRELKDGTIGGFPYHIKALLRATQEYGFTVDVGDKFGILPIMTEETTGVKKIRRKRVEIAFPLETGLPDNYKIDYEYYLRSNLFGKISQLFDTTPKKLEKEIMTDNILIHLKTYKKSKKSKMLGNQASKSTGGK